MKRFEYSVQDFTGPADMMNTLNSFGQLGWELVSSIPLKQGFIDEREGLVEIKVRRMIFKREVENALSNTLS